MAIAANAPLGGSLWTLTLKQMSDGPSALLKESKSNARGYLGFIIWMFGILIIENQIQLINNRHFHPTFNNLIHFILFIYEIGTSYLKELENK
jgi:hypothetical protein